MELNIRLSLAATLVVGLLSLLVLLGGFTIDLTVIFGSGGVHTFTPLHTYFVSSTGNDSNNGTSTSTPWLTPNHASGSPVGFTGFVCGDVILVNPGTYSFGNLEWLGDSGGTAYPVSNCPSTSGGIDGAGGINFAVLLCAGSDLEACKINFTASGAGSRSAIQVTSNNWAVEGFKITSTIDAINTSCMELNAAAVSSSTVLHHFAAINNICYHTGQGYQSNDNGVGNGVGSPGGDYIAVIGNIFQNAANLDAFGVCIAALDGAGMANHDTLAGTHLYFYGNLIANSQSPDCVTVSDGEGIMLDSWEVHLYTGTGVIANNMIWNSMRSCLQFTYAAFSGDGSLHVTFHNNTCYGDDTNIGADSGGGEIDFSGTGSTSAAHLTYANNIALTNRATSGSGPSNVYAAVWGGNTFTNLVNGTVGTENIFKGSAGSCTQSGGCDAGNNAGTNNSDPLGTQFYENPLFANTTDLINNWVSFTPTCTGFVTATACMGFNVNTQSTTALTPIADLVPSSTHSSGKGYQKPTGSCAANSEYPTWLKGIVYLRASGWVNGATVTEYSDLVDKPCGL